MLSVVVAVLNDAMLVGIEVRLLPFGHQELYLILAIAMAAWSGRFLGLFDRATVYT